jgi:hypothetical protein
MKSKLKVGDLVYLKDVGYPYNRTDDGGESFEGASGTVIELNAGYNKDMVRVEFIFPILCNGRGSKMSDCLFHTTTVKKENRPWLKKNLKKLVDMRKEMLKTQEKIADILQRM